MSRTLSKGMSGFDVRQVQDALNYHVQRDFLAPLVVDGDFGEKTDIRVRLFQRDNGLVEDGDVGPITRGLLFEVTEFSSSVLLLDSAHFQLDNRGFPLITPKSKFPLPFLGWSGVGQLPSPFKLISRKEVSVEPGGQATLPDIQGPVAGVSFKIIVPTRHDPKNPNIPKVPAVQVIPDITDNPVGGGMRFKYKLDDGGWVVSGSMGAMLSGGGWTSPLPKLTKSYNPKMFAWGASPGWNGTHGIGANASAQFLVRVTNGPRDANKRPKPQIDLGCWGMWVGRLGGGIGIPVTAAQRAKVIWNAQCGVVGQF